MTRIRTLLIAATLLLCSSLSFAQRDPSLISSRHYVGIEAGINYTFLTGASNMFQSYNYQYRDPGVAQYLVNMPMDNMGGGIGFHLAGTLDLSLSDFLGLQGKVFYATHNSGNTEQHTTACVGGTGIPGTATFEDEFHYNLGYVGIALGLRLQFQPNGIYGIVGIDYNALASNEASGRETIVSSDNDCQYLLLPSQTPTGLKEVSFGPNSIDDFFNSSQLDAKVGVGTFIPIGDNGMVLTPELTVGIPLSTYYTSGTEDAYKAFGATTPKMWYATLSVALKFPFGAKSRDEMSSSNSSEPEDHSSKDDGMVNLTGKVTDANTGEPVKARVTVTDLRDGKIAAQTETGRDGMYDVRVKAPGRYSVTADADGYLFGSTYFEVDPQGRILKGDHDIKLSNATNGRTRLLIFFDFGKDNLQPESYPELERAVTIMKGHPSMEVEIAGYTDNVGGDQLNKDLSLRRAKAVRDYLIRHGIEGNRISAKGYGKDNPILPNDSDEGRAANRRVEFVVLKK